MIRVIAFITALRILLTLQVELAPVESYLWLSCRRPALGYYDFPGMQAWIGWLSTTLIGNTGLGVRLGFLAGGALTVWLTFLAARRFYDEQTARLAAYTVALVPMIFTGTMEAKPDAPLFLFWAATLWALSHALSGGSPKWWYLAGLFLGLAMESKYHAVFLGLGIPAFLLLSPEHRPWLKRKEPWLAVAVALLAFAPTILWNAQNGWQSFLYQGVRRFQENSFSPRQVLNYPVRQLTLVTPFIALAAWAVGVRTLLKWREAGAADRLLALTGLPIIVFFFLLTFTRNIKGYWPGPGYTSLLILGSAAALRGGIWFRRLHLASLAVLVALYVAAPVWLAILPAEKRHSWARLGAEVARPMSDFVVCSDYHLAAQMAFELKSLDVWELTPTGHSVKSFPNWWRPEPYLGRNATVVVEEDGSEPVLAKIRAVFERLDPPTRIMIPRQRLWGAREKERYLIMKAWNYKGVMKVERAAPSEED